MTRVSRLLCVLAAGLMQVTAAVAQAPVLVLAQSEDPVHQEAVHAFSARLQDIAPQHTVAVREGGEVERDELDTAALVVTLGSEAATNAARAGSTAPILHALLSRNALEGLERGAGSGPFTAIVLDQPAARQVALLRMALPAHTHIATLYGTASTAHAKALAAAASTEGLSVRTALVRSEDELYPGLQKALQAPAVLVSLPDTTVFNRYTVQNILMTAYRLRSPVLGHSAAYVRAGAVLGLYTSATQAGHEAAGLAARLLAGDPMPPPAAPRLFEVGVNTTVARALGLQLQPAETLTRALMQTEDGQR
ncbi:MAG: ABC transporter substrate binding protein [Thauera sp.]|jgi:ABC-type uncharacterized transport system substrate-binding protein|nr:ABC transporter substrate binding protein [Thauera sp.]